MQGENAEEEATGAFQAQALLLQQLPWADASQLGQDEVASQLVEPLMGFADLLSRRHPQPGPEWAAAADVLLKVRPYKAEARKKGVIALERGPAHEKEPFSVAHKQGLRRIPGHVSPQVLVEDWLLG